MMYRVGRIEELNARMASRTKRERMYDRAERRAEPHWAHDGDIEVLADAILTRWLRRAVRTGDEIVFLARLHALESGTA